MIVRVKKILRIFFALFRQPFDLSNWQKIPFLRVYFSIQTIYALSGRKIIIPKQHSDCTWQVRHLRGWKSHIGYKKPWVAIWENLKKFYRLPCD